MDVLEALDLFTQYAARARRLSPRTIASYRSDVTQFGTWVQGENDLTGEVEDITACDVEGWVASRSHVSPSSIQRNLAALGSMFRFLLRRQIVAHDPVRLVERPRSPHRQPRVLTEEELRRIAAVLGGSREQAILALLVGLGLRRSEVLNLDGCDVDMSARRLHVRSGKGNRDRVLPIPGDVQAALEGYLEEQPRAPHEPLFLGCHGRRLSRSALARLSDRWLEDAGLKGLGLSPHACRHFAATRWLGSGLTLPEVQMMLGHSDVAITGRYVHVTVHEIASKLDAISLRTPLAEQSEPEAAALDPAWRDLLGRLTERQRQALLAVARAMLADTKPSAGPSTSH